MKVLITELIWQEGIDILKEAGYQVDYHPELFNQADKLKELLGEYDGLIVRNQTLVNESLLAGNNSIKVIGRLGVGLDNLDISYLKSREIPVIAAKHANATSVAEYVLAAMLDHSRNISVATNDIRNGNWNRKRFTGVELSGKTLGLYGLGEISHRVAKRAKAFGMNIVGLDPFITTYEHIISETGVHQVHSLDALLENADFISIHVPLTKETQHIFNKETFKKMKETSVIINTARGGIIAENDLCESIERREIAGAYLDVLEQEPPSSESRLFKQSEISLTPHIAGLTEESQIRISKLVALEIIKVLKGGRSLCTV